VIPIQVAFMKVNRNTRDNNDYHRHHHKGQEEVRIAEFLNHDPPYSPGARFLLIELALKMKHAKIGDEDHGSGCYDESQHPIRVPG
jgi:hypothetical protein